MPLCAGKFCLCSSQTWDELSFRLTQVYMAAVREAFPDTRFFALRTDSHIRIAPRREEPKRWSWLNHPNTNAYVSQMNDVLRHVAAAEGMPLVDYERVATQLPQVSFTSLSGEETGCNQR